MSLMYYIYYIIPISWYCFGFDMVFTAAGRARYYLRGLIVFFGCTYYYTITEPNLTQLPQAQSYSNAPR
jgi:hypothetical protein